MKKYRISLLFLPIAVGLAFLCLQESNDKQTKLLTDELVCKMIEIKHDQNFRYKYDLLYELKKEKDFKLDSAWIDDLDDFDKRFIGFDSMRATFMAELKPLLKSLVDRLEKNLNMEVRRKLPQLCEYALADHQLGTEINWVQFRAKCLRSLYFQNMLHEYNKKYGFSGYCNLKFFNQVIENDKKEVLLKMGYHKVVSERDLFLRIGAYKDSLKDVYKVELPIKEVEAANRMIHLRMIRFKGKDIPFFETEINYQLK